MQDTTKVPRVSVVVPVFNVESYLNECIDSLLTQTLKDIEIILVNDGSTDNSARICDNYDAKYENIKVIHQVNKGISAARNAGILVARGEYIGFVDSDDYVAPNMYEHLINLAEKDQADMVKAAHVRFSDDADKHSVRLPSNLGNCSIDGGELAFCMYYTNRINVNVWDSIYQKRILSLIQFPDGRINEDDFFTPKALFVSRRVCLSTEALYYHRLRPGSIMQSFSLKHLDSVISCIDIDQFLHGLGKGNLCKDQLAGKKVQKVNTFLKRAAKKLSFLDYISACKELRRYFSVKDLFELAGSRLSPLRSRLHILLFILHPSFVFLKERLFQLGRIRNH